MESLLSSFPLSSSRPEWISVFRLFTGLNVVSIPLLRQVDGVIGMENWSTKRGVRYTERFSFSSRSSIRFREDCPISLLQQRSHIIRFFQIIRKMNSCLQKQCVCFLSMRSGRRKRKQTAGINRVSFRVTCLVLDLACAPGCMIIQGPPEISDLSRV